MLKRFILPALLIFFLALFIAKSVDTMITVPLHDFDEANRAEGAKNMKEFGQYYAPLTGSPFLRVEEFRFEVPGMPHKTMYFHFERPPLVYWAMIISTTIFGTSEFAYRLPSFVFGLAGFGLFVFFSLQKKIVDTKIMTAFLVSCVAFLTSYDWWLSSQSALLDTALSTFMFGSLGFLFLYLSKRCLKWVVFSGLFLGLAIMSKGPPSIFLIIPAIYVLLIRNRSLIHFFIWIATASLIVFPWILISSLTFGFLPVMQAFIFNFVSSRAGIPTPEQQAPIFWYARWWMESFRTGFVLFAVFVAYDFLTKKLTPEKITVLIFIIPGFLLYSLVSNKVWWYVLPFIPAVSFYIYLSLQGFLSSKHSFGSLSLLLFMVAIPVLYGSSNTIALAYGIVLFSIGLILIWNAPRLPSLNPFIGSLPLIIILVLSLVRFPVIKPTYAEAKEMGAYYQSLPEPKCLVIEGMPYESILFYSDAKEVRHVGANKINTSNCKIHTITPIDSEKFYDQNRFSHLKIGCLNIFISQ